MKICLDAGHNWSGFDLGASGNGLKEQDITFSIAHKLANKLKNYGIEVIETRPTKETNLGYDTNSSLQARCDIANKANADYFISIHCNAGDSKANGTETFAYKPNTVGEKLAKVVNTALVNEIKTTNRGVKFADFKVLRSTTMPAILIEVGFITNYNDANILKNKQDDIVNGILKGILNFLGVEYKEVNSMNFKDENQISEWAKSHIERAVKFGIMNGNADGTFNPKGTVTREQLAVVVSNIIRYLSGK